MLPLSLIFADPPGDLLARIGAPARYAAGVNFSGAFCDRCKADLVVVGGERNLRERRLCAACYLLWQQWDAQSFRLFMGETTSEPDAATLHHDPSAETVEDLELEGADWIEDAHPDPDATRTWGPQDLEGP